MADEQQVLRTVNWNEVFSFTHIFKSFKMAIHPSKLVLCLAALILMFVTGVVLDTIWGLWGGYAMPGEIGMHATSTSAAFAKNKKRWRDNQREEAARLLAEARTQFKKLEKYEDKAFPITEPDVSEYLKSAFQKKRDEMDEGLRAWTADDIKKDEEASAYTFLRKAEAKFDQEADKIAEVLDYSRDAAERKIRESEDLKAKDKEDELEKLRASYLRALRQLSLRKRAQRQQIKGIRGERISAAFLDYQWLCVRRAVAAVCYGNITSGLANYAKRAQRRGVQPIAEPDTAAAALKRADLRVEPADNPAGLLVWTLMAYRGVVWLIREHWLYAAIYLLVAMCIWAFFGGAVHRIAAVHFARDEKISIKHALRFSCGKFFSFFCAPLIPVGIILLLGALILIGALLLNIPWIGEIIVGVLFFLAVLLGLAIAFLAVGFAGGGAMMYPTIAAEGSDSFDGISRSFSYVFARPWRTGLYALVAVFYGVATYLFVRLFAFLALAATHYFGKWGVFVGGNELDPAADKLDVVWTAPTFGSLFGRFSWDAMSGTQSVGAFIIGIWVFLVATLVLAYMLSYFASASTVVYFLLRRKVDATDLDDVYLEEAEEEPMVPARAEPAEGEQAPAEQAGEAETPAGEQAEAAGDQPAEDEDQEEDRDRKRE